MSERPRDLALERYLTGLAAHAAGFTRLDGTALVGDDGGLGAFADARAYTGPVFLACRSDGSPRDMAREAREELADARNYCLWGIEPIYAAFQAGDSHAAQDYSRFMRALSHTVRAWHALR